MDVCIPVMVLTVWSYCGHHIVLQLVHNCFIDLITLILANNNDDLIVLGCYTLYPCPTGPITGLRPKGLRPVIRPTGHGQSILRPNTIQLSVVYT
jgi:hypothetical protein